MKRRLIHAAVPSKRGYQRRSTTHQFHNDLSLPRQDLCAAGYHAMKHRSSFARFRFALAEDTGQRKPWPSHLTACDFHVRIAIEIPRKYTLNQVVHPRAGVEL